MEQVSSCSGAIYLLQLLCLAVQVQILDTAVLSQSFLPLLHHQLQVQNGTHIVLRSRDHFYRK